ncbi:Lysozyme-like domain superfamily [Sesbania bispinosa]|nr:Lysozyme-like domain superfamily [Sesbania bispinosa]
MEKRVPGFGTTMNILYGDGVCGQGDVDSMNNIVSHYLYYLDLLGVGREEAGSMKPFHVLSSNDIVVPIPLKMGPTT